MKAFSFLCVFFLPIRLLDSHKIVFLHTLIISVMKTEFSLRKDQEYIHLIQLLKATNMVDSGALAQDLVVEGEVRVNGEVEYQKRKKIRKGDRVEIWDEEIEII